MTPAPIASARRCRSTARSQRKLRAPLTLSLAIGGLLTLLSACGSQSQAQNRPHGGTVTASSTALAPDSLPACFQQAEPDAPPAGDRQDAYSALRRGATPIPGKAPQVATLVAGAPFPLYALNVPATEYAPSMLRSDSAATGATRVLLGFALQYRAPAKAGGAIVSLSETAATAVQPSVSDLDDSLDAIRLAARLANRSTPDPLADPAAALNALGCPQHDRASVNIGGATTVADVMGWPGAPNVLRLRLLAGKTELTMEIAGLDRAAALTLAGKLALLDATSPLLAQLSRAFDGAAAPGR